MTSRTLFLVLFVSYSPAQGIILPGQCPDVKPIVDRGDFFFAQTLYSIPWADFYVPLDFFRGRSNHEVNYVIPQVRSEDGVFKGISYMDLLSDGSMGHFVWDKVEYTNSSLTLSGRIFDNEKRLCIDHIIYENLHLWVENEFVLMWTCKEGDVGHDEALFLYSNTYFPHSKVLSLEPVVKELVRKYVGDHMSQLIDFNNSIQVSLPDKRGYFHCPSSTVEVHAKNIEVPLTWIVIILVVLFWTAIGTRVYLSQNQ